jgi:hypothetical protein
MSKQTEPPAAPIRFETNVIIPDPNAPGGSRFIVAGADSPYRSIDEVPINLRPVIVTGEAEEPEGPNEARGSFQLGEVYQVTEDNRLGRRVQRQVAEMKAAAEEDAWIEEEANTELPPEIAAGLQQDHESHIAFAAAQAAADAKRADQIADSVAADAEPPQLYVKRGSRHYVEIHRTKLKPAEPVFTKDAGGAYEFIGETDSKASPPDPPIIL